MSNQDNLSETDRIRNFCYKYRYFLIILLIAVIIRVVLSWFVVHHDSISWLKTIQNVESSVGLYKLEGLWYTPVFGYILSFIAYLGDFLGCFPIQYTSVPEFVFINYSNIPTPEYNFLIKIPMLLGDFLVAYILYILVKEYWGERGALIVTGLWLLSPIIWHMSAAQGQFDALCIGLFLISFLCLRKNQFVISGIFLALSVWLKIFPVMCGPLMLMYIYKKIEDKSLVKRNIALFFVGIIATTLVVFTPQIINGELLEAFKFITCRTTDIFEDSLINQLTSYRIYAMIVIVTILLVFILKRYYTCDYKDLEKMLFVYSAFMIACGAAISLGYQYAPSIILCLIALIVAIPRYRKVFVGSFLLVSILTYLEAARHIGQMHFAIAAVYYGWFDPGKLASDFASMTEMTQMPFLCITALWQIIALATMAFAFVCFVWPEKIGIKGENDERLN